MKDLKYEHQSISPCEGGSNLILGTDTENHMFILRAPATIKFFHQILQNCHFGVKNKLLPTLMDLYDLHVVSYRGTNKIQFFDKISSSGKIC